MWARETADLSSPLLIGSKRRVPHKNEIDNRPSQTHDWSSTLIEWRGNHLFVEFGAYALVRS